MANAAVAPKAQAHPDQAELPLTQRVVLEAVRLEYRLAALEQNGDPGEQATIMSRLGGALSLMRGESRRSRMPKIMKPKIINFGIFECAIPEIIETKWLTRFSSSFSRNYKICVYPAYSGMPS